MTKKKKHVVKAWAQVSKDKKKAIAYCAIHLLIKDCPMAIYPEKEFMGCKVKGYKLTPVTITYSL